MLELTDWFGRLPSPEKPWLVLGKGPTLDRRSQFDLTQFHVLALNHVVNVVGADVAHVIDIGVVGDCADALIDVSWLLMPRVPHVQSMPGTNRLEEWFDEFPVLREIDGRGRLVWYNGSNGAPVAGSPVINTGTFSSEAVLRILGRMGVKMVRTLGIDGGRSYAQSLKELESSTLLENAAPGFDVQFDALHMIADEYDIDFGPLMDPLRIFVDTPEADIVAYRVLEYSIRRAATLPVEVVPILRPTVGGARRAAVESSRPMDRVLPPLGDFRGRAVHLDAAALVLGDVTELHDLALPAGEILAGPPPGPEGADDTGTGGAPLVLLDGGAMSPDLDRFVVPREANPRPTYAELASELHRAGAAGFADVVPAEWNHCDVYEPGRTKLIRFTTSDPPWRAEDAPLGELWMACYREAVEVGAVPPAEVELLIDAGDVRRSLRGALRLAPSRRSVLTSASLDLITAQKRIALLESQIEAMEQSSSWRIGSRLVRWFTSPRRLVTSATRARRGSGSS